MIAELVYILSVLLSVSCATLLLRYYRSTRSRLLLWSSLSFMLLAVNDIILVVDYVVLPRMDFSGPSLRDILAAGAGLTMLIGLLWEAI